MDVFKWNSLTNKFDLVNNITDIEVILDDRYVTLHTDQTIDGLKTFDNDVIIKAGYKLIMDG